MINKKNKAKSLAKIISQLNNSNNRKILGTIVSLFSVLLIISFVSYLFEWKADDSVLSKEGYTIFNNETNNQIGGLGAQLSHRFIKLWFGISALLIPYLTLILGLSILGFKKFKLNKVVTNTLLALIILPITIHHFFDAMILAGGLGIFIDEILIQAIGNIGTSIVLITIISLNIIISFKINSKHFLILNKLKLKGFTLRKNIKVEAKDTEQVSDENTNIIEEVKEENISETKTENQIEIKEKEDELIDDIGLEVISNKNEGSLSKSEIEKKLKELGDFDPTLELSKFKMPTMNLLNDHGENKIEVDKSELEKNKNKIVETLGHYNIGITSISATVGPTITLYEIVPEAGVRISKIKNLEDDISLSLAAEGIRIIAPIPGKGTIGIEVPNANKNTVSMLEVLQSEKFQNSKMELPIAFGKTISNETFIVDLAKMPHLLMAGATGQGKSVGLNAMLVSLLYKKHPSQIKFVLVDPKKVELTLFNKIERHYLAKLPDSEDAIITDTKKVVNTVNSLCIEMDERYELCKNANCRNIKEYNAKFISRKLNPNDGHRFLPYIVLVIDEFADLIMTAGKEIETPIARLAQLARAIGIHLIVATQRPSVNVITGIIKANFPARVAFRVTSTIDSRTIMDTKGAEQLIGMGDMLISTGNDLTRLQCAFIDTPEVEKICEYIGSQRAYPQAHILPEFEGEADAVGSKADLNELDSMFNEAAAVLVKHQSGSTSLIQRKLRLGYNRAGSIIDQLEAAGIVGPFEGSKARKVLVKDEIALQEILKNLNNE
ncbi:MAG: DNA translocase FtsK 4TM domain-containing protein [Flavobacteriales bacterium]|nr:DNA translocase FtsK 4TM domain-containing protein [Flavobacteriales bacterium]